VELTTMGWLWGLCLLTLALAVASLVRYQRTTSRSGRLLAGSAALISGVIGLVLLAVLVL
jgi:hypothetical protein